MALNNRDIIVFDFETGSRNPYKTQPTQIAAVVIHGKSLNIKTNGVFNSEMKPILDDEEAIAAGLDPVEDEALDITRKTRKALAKAPTPKYVWRKFKPQPGQLFFSEEEKSDAKKIVSQAKDYWNYKYDKNYKKMMCKL